MASVSILGAIERLGMSPLWVTDGDDWQTLGTT